MDILFKTGKLEKICNDQKRARRQWGPERSKLVLERLDDLRAMDTLEDIRTFPHRGLHELSGDRKGQLSMDLDGPYRLIFEPADVPLPLKPDGGLNWSRITAVRILEVVDTHG